MNIHDQWSDDHWFLFCQKTDYRRNLVISTYAQQYGIGEYVELIEAVMMQESGGRGTDPMQCSESPYNRKYSHAPNSIKDPEYSINCGAHYLEDCLKQARCKSPVDMNHIRLALQGYNYGNGYIPWTIKRDGGYTVANAIAFSDMQAKKHGWKSYGDKQYPAHVLQYYPYGSYNIGMGNTAIRIMLAQVQNGQCRVVALFFYLNAAEHTLDHFTSIRIYCRCPREHTLIVHLRFIEFIRHICRIR